MTSLKTLAGRPITALDDLGGQLRFYVTSPRLEWANTAPIQEGEVIPSPGRG